MDEPSDWIITAAIHGFDQLNLRRFLFTEDIHALNSQEGNALFFKLPMKRFVHFSDNLSMSKYNE